MRAYANQINIEENTNDSIQDYEDTHIETVDQMGGVTGTGSIEDLESMIQKDILKDMFKLEKEKFKNCMIGQLKKQSVEESQSEEENRDPNAMGDSEAELDKNFQDCINEGEDENEYEEDGREYDQELDDLIE